MPRKYSLNKKRDFDRVFKQGKRLKSPVGTILFAPQAQAFDHPRFGLMVSKKISLKAVIRNTIKRRIKEALRRNLNLIKSYDFVIIPYPDIKDKDYHFIESSIVDTFKKIY